MSKELSAEQLSILRFLWEMQTDGRERFPYRGQHLRVRMPDGVARCFVAAEFLLDGCGRPTCKNLDAVLTSLKLRQLIEEEPVGIVFGVAYRAQSGLIVRAKLDEPTGWITVTVESDDKVLKPFPVSSFRAAARGGLLAYSLTAKGVDAALENADAVARGEEWSIPMSLADLANRLGNIGSDKAKTILKPYGLKRAGNRQLWSVRLDLMPLNLRHRIEGKK